MLTSNTTTAISGLGGIGKTQTAIEYAYRYQQDYQYIFWVQSATHEELVGDLVAVATELNLPQQHEQDQNIILNAVKRWLGMHAGWLLIFDNADDLEMLRPFLPAANAGHTLFTTRSQTMGGIVYIVEIDQMRQEEGSLFLLRRAGYIAQHQTLVAVPQADQAIARDIVREMDGLPLALDQAGAYIEETKSTLNNYLSIYRRTATHRRKLLQWRGEQLLDHHPIPVFSTWSLSFGKVEQANAGAADILRLCALLAPDAIPEAILVEGASELGPRLAPVANDPFDRDIAIRELLKYSLIHRDSGKQTLTVHRLVQVVIKENMDEQTQRQWAERAIRAVNRAFPHIASNTRSLCQALIPHAQTCADLIIQWDIASPEAGRLLNQAGFYLANRAQYAEALPLCQRALAIREKVLGPEHLDTATSLNNLGYLYHKQGHYTEALPLYQRALAIREKVLGPEHLDTTISLASLAALYENQGHYTEALPLYQRALAIREKVLGPEHPKTAISLTSLAALYSNQGRYTEALPLYQRALTIYEKVLGPEHPYTTIALVNYASVQKRIR